MIVARFKVRCRPERTAEMRAALVAVEGPSRAIPGVVRFDCACSVTDPDEFVVTEVFEDRAAFDAQNAQAEVAAVLRLANDGALTGPFEFTFWDATPLD